jgi:hypothetical protein
MYVEKDIDRNLNSNAVTEAEQHNDGLSTWYLKNISLRSILMLPQEANQPLWTSVSQ